MEIKKFSALPHIASYWLGNTSKEISQTQNNRQKIQDIKEKVKKKMENVSKRFSSWLKEVAREETMSR